MKADLEYCFGLDIQAQMQPYKKAIITEQAAISYLELLERSSQLADMLLHKGLKPGDTILIFMPNCIEYAIVFFAAARIQLNIALANVLYRDSELKPLVKTTCPKMAFVANDTQAKQLHMSNPELTTVCITEGTGVSYEISKTDIPSECSRHHSDMANTLSSVSWDSNRACIYTSTSGSTGKPKVIANKYKNEFINASLYVDKMLVTNDDILLTALPATQRFGMAAMLGSCIKGATLVLTSKFRAKVMLSLIEKYKVSVQYGVPTMFLKEIDAFHKAEMPPDISSLRTGVVAGSNCCEDIFLWFETHTGCRLLNCYGTSEIGGLTMVDYYDPDDVRHHTCGQVLKNAMIEIRNCQGQVLPPGKTGEVTCYVPWVMNGYVGEPGLTSKMFDDRGFFLTGDIGKLDEKGNLIIRGRKKDLIIRGGYNIFPSELEHALINLSTVTEACVIGYHDNLLGERIIAFVKPADGTVQEENIRKELAGHIAKYKLPDQIIFIQNIPKLPNGKFDCPALRVIFEQTNNGKAEKA